MSFDSGDGPLAAYRARLAAGGLAPDPAQALAAEKLESLFRALKGYRPAGDAGGWRARLGLAPAAETPPQGLYLFGAVGRGKSMLMDLFFAAAPALRKRRVHFHAFMLEVHERLHKWRQKDPPERGGKDPIPPLARKLAEEAWLLCFDEFQVTNIADAMILGRLLGELFQRGVVVVATSNTAPDDLYERGLQRDRFLPSIAVIKDRLDVLELDAAADYRSGRIKAINVYYTPLGQEASDALRDAFRHLTEGEEGASAAIPILGRALTLRRAAKGVALSTFAELCEQPLGAADFGALATRFHTLVLDGVIAMGPELRNEARRFMTLIDELYEHRVKLVLAAACAPEALYPAGEHAGEFRRTVSRLHEMGSEDYLLSPHLR
ncbi:MAG: cell division protein ZapE [Pseudomonadota bacterium]